MKNGKESTLYKSMIANIWFLILSATTYLIPDIYHHVKNMLQLVLILVPLIILWIISLISFINKWDEILKSKDPE